MRDARPPRWLVAVAGVMVAASKLLLVRFRTPTVLAVLAGSARDRKDRRLDPDLAARSVARAGRVLRAECLPQAVALASLLQRAGQRPTVVLGCRLYGPGNWGAHAWVDLDGRQFDSIVEREEDHAELARLSAETRWQVQGALDPGFSDGLGV